jgi:coproporphyrinogen III oxidase
LYNSYLKFKGLVVDFRDYSREFQNIQEDIKRIIARHEPQAFIVEDWQHAEGGGGRTCVIEKSQVIEKGGVNFSDITAAALPKSATAARPHIQNKPFRAMGVSVVMHPCNPYVPTSHFNVRLIQTLDQQDQPLWWVGGGFDLTPYYGFAEDCVLWHQAAKDACDPYGEDLYPRFKKWCDDYFCLKHRGEARGIGGIFFDDFNALSLEKSLEFLQRVARSYSNAYDTLLTRRKEISFGERERAFQLYRRGRYVEFNLVYDRGTLFGLQSGGRTESILMSLPPDVAWRYNWKPELNSAEARLYNEFLPIQDWIKA